jgi:hypothetical protein
MVTDLSNGEKVKSEKGSVFTAFRRDKSPGQEWEKGIILNFE